MLKKNGTQTALVFDKEPVGLRVDRRHMLGDHRDPFWGSWCLGDGLVILLFSQGLLQENPGQETRNSDLDDGHQEGSHQVLDEAKLAGRLRHGPKPKPRGSM